MTTKTRPPLPRLAAVLLTIATIAMASPTLLHADDSALDYYRVDLDGATANPRRGSDWKEAHPTARLSSGTIYQVFPADPTRDARWGQFDTTDWVAALPAGVDPADVTLAVVNPQMEWEHVSLSERIEESPREETERIYWQSRAFYYGELVDRQMPGGAFFRARHEDAMQRLSEEDGKAISETLLTRRRWLRRREWNRDDTFGLMSGGQAMRENLALDMVVESDNNSEGAEATVELDSIQGISVEAIDWAPYLAEMEAEPQLDSLARVLPEDNIAAFAPSFDSVVAMIDATETFGNPMADAVSLRSSNSHVRERYEAQLLLPLDAAARMLGAAVIDEMAFTADDLYFIDGTGVAVVMRAKQPAMLRQFLAGARNTAIAASSDVTARTGEVAGVSYEGAANPSRRVSHYAAWLSDDVVVVSNGVELLGRIAATHKGDVPSIADLDEYRFFRDRYRRGAEHEDLFVLMTDAAIRKWTGPRWRIAQSRRVRAAAALADLSVRHIDELLASAANPNAAPTNIRTAWVFTGPTEVSIIGGEARHSTYGTSHFLTPIAEMPLTHATKWEANEYAEFRERYTRRWSQFFDPIAIQANARGGLEADITVMPLILGTQYRRRIEFTEGGFLAPDAGDPHDEAILHFIWHLNPEGREVQMVQSMLAAQSGRGSLNPLAWMSGPLEAYFDKGEYWDEFKGHEPDARPGYAERSLHRMPIGVRIGSSSPLGLAAFLTTIRGLVDTSAPGLVTWNTRQEGETSYVEIRPVTGDEMADMFRIFYVAQSDGLTITLDEELLRRAIRRHAARKAGTAKPPAEPWMGGSMAMRMSGDVIAPAIDLLEPDAWHTVRIASAANVVILNEWRALYPDRDPVEVHRALTGVVLECPGGEGYQWSEESLGMESVALGGAWSERGDASTALPPVGGIAAGVTFEENGLRAGFRLEARDAAEE